MNKKRKKPLYKAIDYYNVYIVIRATSLYINTLARSESQLYIRIKYKMKRGLIDQRRPDTFYSVQRNLYGCVTTCNYNNKFKKTSEAQVSLGVEKRGMI
jgi:hypothetical protein